MRFWIREILGWLLVGLGLLIFYMCVVLLFNHSVIEVGPLFIIGIFVFRGGIHLLKVAVAARICMLAQAKMEGSPGAVPKVAAKARAFRPTLGRPTIARDIRKTR